MVRTSNPIWAILYSSLGEIAKIGMIAFQSAFLLGRGLGDSEIFGNGHSLAQAAAS